jgi:hypothetical protein
LCLATIEVTIRVISFNLNRGRPYKTVATVQATDPRTFVESDDLVEQIAPVTMGKPARVSA